MISARPKGGISARRANGPRTPRRCLLCLVCLLRHFLYLLHLRHLCRLGNRLDNIRRGRKRSRTARRSSPRYHRCYCRCSSRWLRPWRHRRRRGPQRQREDDPTDCYRQAPEPGCGRASTRPDLLPPPVRKQERQRQGVQTLYLNLASEAAWLFRLQPLLRWCRFGADS